MNLDIGVFNLTADKQNVIVQARHIKEDGGETLRFGGYYGTVPAALRSLSVEALNQSEAQSKEELLAAIDRHEKYMERLIASVDFDRYRYDLIETREGESD